METHSLYILKAFSDYDLQITLKNLIIWETVLVCLRQLSISVPQSQYGGNPTPFPQKSPHF